MASKDVKRLNPGISVKNLFPGVASKANPKLIVASSAPVFFETTLLACPVIELGAQPTFAFALNASGSLVLLEAS